jgi:CheY-like chemotaxis protein
LGEGWTTIGRGDGNTFQVIAASISGRHCEVRLQEGELRVRDLLSTNGTFIGGRRISEGTVKPGESLRLGNVNLRFEVGDFSGAPSPVPIAVPIVVPIPAVVPAPVPAAAVTVVTSLDKAQPVAAAPPAAPPAIASPPPAPSAPPAIVPTPLAQPPVMAAAPLPATPAPALQSPPPPADHIEPEKLAQVLFVDDSVAFLELFGSLCEEYSGHTWKIHKASSADAALAVLRETVMDLVLLDITMPMLDGLQLLAILNRRYPGMKIAIMTGCATEGKRADALANGAELFLEKMVTVEGMHSVFNVLNDLLSWDRDGFTGGLRQVNLQEVIQVECNGRHSSILEIRNPQVRGQIYIEAGAITHAAVGDITGEPAFHRLLALRGGSFQVKAFRAPPQRTINTAWEFLLMDAARATDEETVVIKKPAPPPPSAPADLVTHQAVGDDVMIFPDGDPHTGPDHGPGH